MKKATIFLLACVFATPSMAQFVKPSSAIYGDVAGETSGSTKWQNDHPGWTQSPVAGSTAIVHYLERASGIPVARKPDPGRVKAFSAYDVYGTEPSVAVAQHPLEGFGYSRPAQVPAVSYADLPQNRGKIVKAEKMNSNWVDDWWSNFK